MKKVYFVSDAHLGAPYIANAREHEQRLCDMLEEFARDADEIYMLGDMLDYWYEYRTVVPRGHVRFFGCLARLADQGIKLHYIIGNHDIWLFDYLRDEIGMEVIDGATVRTIMGKNFFLSHGDDMGRHDLSFRIIRNIFRNRLCQRLYSAIHPRWTVPFAQRWSSHSRQSHDESEYQFKGEDREPALQFARQYLAQHPDIDFFISGHRHIELDLAIGPHTRYIVLGDCLNRFTYAVFDGTNLELRNHSAKKAH
jgi:UDP-2,3-diacylglucosamine hydrolase